MCSHRPEIKWMRTRRDRTTELAGRLERLSASDFGRRIGAAVVWGGLAAVLGRGLPVFAMMLVARLLGATEFGKLTLLLSTALAFEVLITSGLAITCTKFVSDHKGSDPQRAGRMIDLAFIVSAAMAVWVGC